MLRALIPLPRISTCGRRSGAGRGWADPGRALRLRSRFEGRGCARNHTQPMEGPAQSWI